MRRSCVAHPNILHLLHLRNCPVTSRTCSTGISTSAPLVGYISQYYYFLYKILILQNLGLGGKGEYLGTPATLLLPVKFTPVRRYHCPLRSSRSASRSRLLTDSGGFSSGGRSQASLDLLVLLQGGHPLLAASMILSTISVGVLRVLPFLSQIFPLFFTHRVLGPCPHTKNRSIPVIENKEKSISESQRGNGHSRGYR